MFGDAGSRTSRAMAYVRNCWIVGLIGVERLAMRAIAHRAGPGGFTGANVGRWRRRESVAIAISNVKSRARGCWVVRSICAAEGVIGASVVSVRFKVSERARVGRGPMKGLLATFHCHFVDQLAIRC
ncbi:unnamed protein product [Camellia sinensis]